MNRLIAITEFIAREHYAHLEPAAAIRLAEQSVLALSPFALDQIETEMRRPPQLHQTEYNPFADSFSAKR
jgi:hypothetical protein